ncbi:MAG TPA: acetylornithine transaminase [Candidatus Solibacter sp.]|jgi:acetylornithine/N-succinyldiaminopimelate aminotransferase|nr:acetylornithine transaminase [Candidatus Solibacter sp.]
MTDTIGAGLEALAEAEHTYLMHTFTRQPVELVRGDRWNLYDPEGNEYLDFVAGIAVNLLGHNHPDLVEAISRQAAQAIHLSDLYYSRPQVELAKRLNQLGFTGRAFYCNSGAEANECAIKIARKWGKQERYGAFEIICANQSFHGRTLAAIAATGQPKYQKPFLPMPEGFAHVDYNDLGAIKEATDERTVAILLEPVQGESGIVPASQEYLEGVRAWCDEHNLLMILDEVQTGVGRTGFFYAFQAYGITPDVVTLAKGLGGGVPIGICLAGPRADVLGPGEHGSTFGGNPLASAAALAVLDVLERDSVVENARNVGAYLLEELRRLVADFDCVADVRGSGLMAAMVLDRDIAKAVEAGALEHGLLVNAIGDRVIRMVPPLIIGKPEVDRAIAILEQVLDLVMGHVPAPPKTPAPPQAG